VQGAAAERDLFIDITGQERRHPAGKRLAQARTPAGMMDACSPIAAPAA
jgi:hypothetical protein